jgi:hypothetical protein
MASKRIGRWTLACGFLLFASTLARAVPAEDAFDGPPGRGGRPPLAVAAAASKIVVDGVLDEPAWQTAAKLPLRFETRPAENTLPPVETEVFVTYDHDSLFVAFRAHDPKPGEIRAHLSDRDTAFNDDFVGIVLDTFNDERRAFEFFVNPLGVQMDLFQDDVNGNEDETWDAIWRSAGKIDGDGFAVEIAIPWSSLRFPRREGAQTWGFDALRFYPRGQRHRISGHPLDRNVSCYLCQASKMTGFSGVTPGLNMEVVPTVTANRNDGRANDALDQPFRRGGVKNELGVTGKWGVTPNLTLNAAIHPDFSQIEADAAQLDVNTQFALFFPEKRPFFLEGADFFRTPFNAVFTRNVADPAWGAKLTGKEGANGIGLFVAHDDRTNLILPGSNGSSLTSFAQPTTDTVLRYRRDLGGSSALGVLFTGREGDRYSNRVAGLDGLYRLNDKNFFRGQLLRSQTRYPAAQADTDGDGIGDFDLPPGTRDGRALWLSYDYSARDWYGYGRYEDVGSDFRADMGFMPRVGYTYRQAGGGHNWYGDRWTRVSLGSEWNQRDDSDGQLLGRSATLFFNLDGPRQSSLGIQGGQRRTVYNGVTFDQVFASLNAGAQPSGSFSFGLYVQGGDQIDYVNTQAGRVVHIEPNIRLDLGRRSRTRLSHLYETLDVKGGRLYTANLTQLTDVFQLNVRTFFRAIVQYTRVERTPALYIAQDPADVTPKSEHLFTQLLFSYKLNPQTVVFLGYSDNSLADQTFDLTRANRTFFLKLGYAWLP